MIGRYVIDPFLQTKMRCVDRLLELKDAVEDEQYEAEATGHGKHASYLNYWLDRYQELALEVHNGPIGGLHATS